MVGMVSKDDDVCMQPDMDVTVARETVYDPCEIWSLVVNGEEWLESGLDYVQEKKACVLGTERWLVGELAKFL